MPRIASLLLAVVAGTVLSVSFPNVGIWLCAPLAIAILVVALQRHHAGWNFLVGWIMGLAFFLPHLTWANYAVGPVPWIALSIASALFFGLVAAAWTWARRIPLVVNRQWLAVPAFATLWAAMEEARARFPFDGFPWGRVAFSQSDSPIGRLAWLGGAPLVTWVTCAAGVCLALVVIDVARTRRPVRLPARPVRLTALSTGAVGLVLIGSVVPLASGAEVGTLRLGAVQGNVSNPGIHAFDEQREVLNNHLSGTYALARSQSAAPLDLVVWPENGTDIDPEANVSAAADIDAAAKAVGAPILVGTVQHPRRGERYNVGLLWAPGAGPIDSYTKMHPVPFAEYIPLRPVARFFSHAVDLVSTDMLPGNEIGVLDLPMRDGRTALIGDVICFEVAIDDQVRQTVSAGAQLLIVQTNNASFGPTAESTQQRAMTKFRAIETGRSTAQVSTVGVSAIYAPNGTMLAGTGLFTAEQMAATVPLRTSLTPAVRTGAYWSWGFGIGGVLLVGAGLGSTLTHRREVRATRKAR